MQVGQQGRRLKDTGNQPDADNADQQSEEADKVLHAVPSLPALE